MVSGFCMEWINNQSPIILNQVSFSSLMISSHISRVFPLNQWIQNYLRIKRRFRAFTRDDETVVDCKSSVAALAEKLFTTRLTKPYTITSKEMYEHWIYRRVSRLVLAASFLRPQIFSATKNLDRRLHTARQLLHGISRLLYPESQIYTPAHLKKIQIMFMHYWQLLEIIEIVRSAICFPDRK